MLADGRVERHFASIAPFWKDVYGQTGVFSDTVRRRHAMALSCIERLNLPPGTPVLENAEQGLRHARRHEQQRGKRARVREIDPKMRDDYRQQSKEQRRVRVDHQVAERHQPDSREQAQQRALPHRRDGGQKSNHPPSTTRVCPVM